MKKRSWLQRGVGWLFPASFPVAILVYLVTSNPFSAVGTLGGMHAISLFGTLRRNCKWLGPVVTEFSGERQVWLTIDDGPGDEESYEILETLERHAVRATFFTIGRSMEKRPELTEELVRRGHTLGNHSYSHLEKWFWCHSKAQLRREVDGWFEALPPTIARKDIGIFRSPVGMKPARLFGVLEKRDLTFIGWNATGLDGTLSDVDKIFERLKRQIRSGSIIVIHEGRGHAPELLEKLIPWVKAQGLNFAIPEEFS